MKTKTTLLTQASNKPYLKHALPWLKPSNTSLSQALDILMASSKQPSKKLYKQAA